MIDGFNIKLIFRRKTVNGHVSWLLVKVVPPRVGGTGRANGINSLSASQKEEETEIRKTEKKTLSTAPEEEKKALKKRQSSARAKRFTHYHKQQEDEESRIVSAYDWINDNTQSLRFIGFDEVGTPQDTANELASIIEAISELSMEEGGRKFKMLAVQRRTDIYGKLAPAQHELN